MDIAALSIAMSQSELSTQVGMKVMGLMKDQSEVAGANIVEQMKSLELSVNPNVGSRIDVSI